MFGFRVWNISESVRFVLHVTSHRAGDAVSGCDTGRRGVAPALPVSCLCAASVPVAPAVGAMLPSLWLVPWWHRVRYDLLVRCMCSGLVGGLPFVARAAWLACVGGLAFIVCVCAFGDFQL